MKLPAISLLLFLSLTGQVLALDIQVLGLFKNMVILRVDGKQHKLKKGKTTPEGIKLISADSDEAILEVNGVEKAYRLGQHVSANYKSQQQPEVKILPVQGMYQTPGLINGQPVQFLVDTGATWIAMNIHQARNLGINFRFTGKRSAVSTANGVAPVYRIVLDRVSVGGIELHNVEAVVVDGSSPREVLLGNSFLNRINMQRNGQVLLLKKKF